MSEQFDIQAETRTATGKGVSRRLRRDNRLPGVLYGAGKGPESVTLDHDSMLINLKHEAFYSHILTIHIGGKKERVVLKDLQRHPSKPILLHIDFMRIGDKEKIRMNVPLHFVNAEQSPAVKVSKGIVTHMMTNVEIACLAKNLPEYIEVDLSSLKEGDTVHLSDIALPEGVEITALVSGHDQGVAAVHIPRSASGGAESGEGGEESTPE